MKLTNTRVTYSEPPVPSQIASSETETGMDQSEKQSQLLAWLKSPALVKILPHCISRAYPTASESGSSPLVKGDINWHYSFDIPWSKMSSNTRKLLDTEKRLSAAERREVIRIVTAEILTMCKKPGKRHITEIARKMIIRYPKSFRDEIQGQVVGTGYDSLVK
ncbi:hypothetical protein SRHO_G00259930 [Serrasalmus rhombeus]